MRQSFVEGRSSYWVLNPSPTVGQTSGALLEKLPWCVRADERRAVLTVALLGEGVAGLAVLAVGVPGAALDALSAAPVVRVAHQVVGAAALVAARQVAAGGTVGARAQAMQALVDVCAQRAESQ